MTKGSGCYGRVSFQTLFNYCHIISLGAEGGTTEGKTIEKIEVRGGAFENTPRPQ